ncbi:MAG: sodium:solute symporter [Ignavibacteriaceae bacterium]|nr:sodium:solute symporter [Ignavibacteriaceae bacterium]
MNLTLFDWLIVVVISSLMIGSVLITKKYMRSVSDFLAAGRTAGRYVISLSQGMAALGSITIVGMFEMNYVAGFNLRWWELTTAVIILGITVSGWVVYRFRETRALTMAQFFEIRYSRNFRIFAGLVAFLSGIINFGIFPAVSARFFIYYCGFPHYMNVAGIEVSTFAAIMFILLAFALFFVFTGGQIAVIVSDFLQGIFVNVVFIIIIIFLLLNFDWQTISAGVNSAPDNASLINPFKTSQTNDFNFWYFLIGMIGLIYGKLSWQGTQAYNSSAKSAHEAKMGEVLSNWRNIPQWGLFLVLVPVVAFVVMHNPFYSVQANNVNSILSTVDSEAIKSQLRVPLVLVEILPVGLVGAFCAVMVAAFIATHDTYLHSWGSILIQDVVMPFRNKPFTQQQHLRALKISIFGVAVFIFIFSLLFQQSEYIFLFFAITGAIFAGGSGAVIIGGLYWKRGTTAAAWSAMITGSVIAVGGIIIQQLWKDFFINGQMFWGIAMAASSLVYVVVSLLGKKNEFDMDKLLNRGKYEIKTDKQTVSSIHLKGIKVLGIGKGFSNFDKYVYYISYIWTFAWFAVFVIGTILNLSNEVSNESWLEFWKYYIFINLGVSIVVITWFLIGGIKNIREMFSKLDTMERDQKDHGFILKENSEDTKR